ncbi:protein canopy homolog 2 [Parasteatoda tepidariorum]|uniref:protein canopy homolog 2 n=1 Tax=Parasteatoda tepidariorum TaxID=114398 RepID=UPI00077FC3D9|nr:protein canopy homolog 2 [Parasteatoda tepidariorum]
MESRRLFLLTFFYLVHISVQQSELRCLVCRLVVNEITSSVINEDPKKILEVGSFRIQPDGSQKQSQIKYAGSETHLGEILETVCNSIEDYAQAKDKETGELTLLNLSKDVDKLSTHELVQDPDLNRSLKYYCESFVEDYEDDVMALFKSSDKFEQFSTKLCTNSAGYCSSKTEL